MPAAKPANLCQFDLPSGKTCRQIALKDDSLCRHHSRLLRHAEASGDRQDKLINLATQLESETLIGMLNILRRRLTAIHRVVRYHPEAAIALRAVIDRIHRINAAAVDLTSCTPDQLEKTAAASKRLISLMS